MKLSLLSFLAAFNVVSSQESGEDQERYLYTIYYDHDDCTSPVALGAHVHDETKIIVGGHDNVTQQCALEATCIMDRESNFCKNDLIDNIEEFEIRNQISKEGEIFQCDKSNEDAGQADCRFLTECYSSSVYPHCHFRLRTNADIVANPEIIHNENADSIDGLSQISYLNLYEDDACQEMLGSQGIVAGGPTVLPHAPASMSCFEATSCLFTPPDQGGTTCEGFGGVTEESTTLHLRPSRENAILCDSGEADAVCEEVEPLCVPSPTFPACYQRIVTSQEFFKNPSEYATTLKIKPDVPETTEGETNEPITPEGGEETGGDTENTESGATSLSAIASVAAMIVLAAKQV